MAEEHVKELLESNPNPTLEEEAAALEAAKPEENTPAIPEKFVRDGKPDYEALAKAYAELEKKQSSGKKDDTDTKETVEEAGKEEEPADTDNPPADEDAAKDAVNKAGLDFDALSNEYWESGKLADSSYEALERAGIPRNLVDGYIAGQQAIVAETKASVFREAGGEQQYDGMISWAAENLSQDEITAYDNAVNSGNMNSVLLAVKGLKARYEAAEGVEPSVNLGGTGRADADSFKSWAQVTKAMNDPRYGKDPAYVAEVEAKLARSNNLM